MEGSADLGKLCDQVGVDLWSLDHLEFYVHLFALGKCVQALCRMALAILIDFDSKPDSSTPSGDTSPWPVLTEVLFQDCPRVSTSQVLELLASVHVSTYRSRPGCPRVLADNMKSSLQSP